MNDKKKYSVSELAEILKAPRTTVNDWLSRYSQYIDFRMQGKRKIYYDSALKVLKEISELRNSELSSFDIEEELAKRHPVNVEEVIQSEEQKPKEKPKSSDDKSEAEAAPAQGEYAMIAKKQTDEIGRLITEQLMNMSNKINELEDINRSSIGKDGRWFGTAICMLLMFIALLAFSAYKITKYLSKIEHLQMGNDRYSEQISEKENFIQKVSVKLQKSSEDYKQNIGLLNKDMQKQQKKFSELLSKKLNEASTKSEADIFALRDNFAKERLKLIKEIEKTANEKKQKEDLIKQLQEQSIHQSSAIAELSKDLKTKVKEEAKKPEDGIKIEKEKRE